MNRNHPRATPGALAPLGHASDEAPRGFTANSRLLHRDDVFRRDPNGLRGRLLLELFSKGRTGKRTAPNAQRSAAKMERTGVEVCSQRNSCFRSNGQSMSGCVW